MLCEVPNTSTILYVILSNGQQIGYPHQSKMLAEATLLSLPENVRQSASIVPITQSGQQVLLG